MLAVNLKPTVGPAKAPAAGRPLWSRDCEDMVLPRPAATGHYVELNIMAGCSQSSFENNLQLFLEPSFQTWVLFTKHDSISRCQWLKDGHISAASRLRRKFAGFFRIALRRECSGARFLP